MRRGRHLSKGYMAELSEWEHVHLEVWRDNANKSFCISQMILFTVVFKNILFPWLQMCWTLEALWRLTMRKPRVRPHFICSMTGVVGLPSTSVLLSRHARTAQTFPPFPLFLSRPPFLRSILQLTVFSFSIWVLGKKSPHVEEFSGALGQWSSVHFHSSSALFDREFGAQMGQVIQSWT